MPCSSVEIFRILYLECEKTPQWNSSVAKCEVDLLAIFLVDQPFYLTDRQMDIQTCRQVES